MLYLIKSGKYSKIGHASDTTSRISSYHTHNPEFELLDTREGTKKEESELHRLLKDKIDHRERMIHDKDIEKLFKEYVFKKDKPLTEPEKLKYENKIKKLESEKSWFYEKFEKAYKEKEEAKEEAETWKEMYMKLLSKNDNKLKELENYIKRLEDKIFK